MKKERADDSVAADREPYYKGTAAMWSRVSSTEQSVENAHASMLALAKSRFLRVGLKFDVEKSAWTGEHRKHLDLMLAYARAGEFDHLIIWSLDRLSREGPLATLQLLHDLTSASVTILSVQEPWLENPELRTILVAILAWIAEWESSRRSERVKAGRERRLGEGKWPGGKPPFGYQQQNGELVLNPDQAALVAQIFEWYVTRSTGIRGISRELEAQGKSSPGGNKNWSDSWIHRVLSDPTYYQGHHDKYGVPAPAIVEESVWARAQRKREANKRRHPPRKDPGALQGLVKCGVCGSNWRMHQSRKSGRSYFCKGRERDSRHYRVTGEGCPVPRYNARGLEMLILVHLGLALEDPNRMLSALDAAAAQLESRLGTGTPDGESMRLALDDVNAEIGRIEEAWIRGKLPSDRLAELQSKAEERKAALGSRLHHLTFGSYGDDPETRYWLSRTREARAKVLSGQWVSLTMATLTPDVESSLREAKGDCDEIWAVYAKNLRSVLERLDAEIVAFEDRFEVRGVVSFEIPSPYGGESMKTKLTSADPRAFSSPRGAG